MLLDVSTDPVCFKTLIGMDFIGVIESEDDEYYHMKSMYAIVPQQNQQTGEVNISFGAAVHPDMGKVNTKEHGSINTKLRKSAVVFPYTPSDTIMDGYKQATSGIQIARTMPGTMPRS